VLQPHVNVTKRIRNVVPLVLQTSRIRSKTLSADLVSRLPVGSSASTNAGCIIKERAIATRCCCPPDRSLDLLLAKDFNPTLSINSVARNRMASSGMARVPVSKIYSVRDMLQDPQFLARKMFEQHQFADGTPVKLPAGSPKLSATPGQTRWLGPELGQHNVEVLQQMGYSSDEIDLMRQDGVI
jgi:hypothetical protein